MAHRPVAIGCCAHARDRPHCTRVGTRRYYYVVPLHARHTRPNLRTITRPAHAPEPAAVRFVQADHYITYAPGQACVVISGAARPGTVRTAGTRCRSVDSASGSAGIGRARRQSEACGAWCMGRCAMRACTTAVAPGQDGPGEPRQHEIANKRTTHTHARAGTNAHTQSRARTHAFTDAHARARRRFRPRRSEACGGRGRPASTRR
jgi:hypothetical protein